MSPKEKGYWEIRVSKDKTSPDKMIVYAEKDDITYSAEDFNDLFLSLAHHATHGLSNAQGPYRSLEAQIENHLPFKLVLEEGLGFSEEETNYIQAYMAWRATFIPLDLKELEEKLEKRVKTE